MDDEDDIVFFSKKLSCQFLKVTRCDFIKTSAGSPLQGLPPSLKKNATKCLTFSCTKFFFHIKTCTFFFKKKMDDEDDIVFF